LTKYKSLILRYDTGGCIIYVICVCLRILVLSTSLQYE